MSGKNQVDFLLEIMKGSTTTKQEQVDEPQVVDGVCGGHCVEDIMEEEAEAELREQPPTSPPLSNSSPSMPTSAPEGVWVVQDFDFYGNPIGERVQPGRPNSINNAIGVHQHQTTTVSQSNQSSQQVARRGHTTEFSDGSTAPSCLVDFSLCLMNSLICSTGPSMLQGANAEDTASKSRSMFGSTQEENVSIAKIEAELQLELEKIRKQKIEMEKWYLREIARQDADRTLLQVQMEQKIVSMMEARMHLESEYRKEIAREVTEVRTLVNTQLDLGSRSDVSDELDDTDAVIVTEQLDTIPSPTDKASTPKDETPIPTKLPKPIHHAQAVPCETQATAMKTKMIVISGTDEESAVETENDLTAYPQEASE